MQQDPNGLEQPKPYRQTGSVAKTPSGRWMARYRAYDPRGYNHRKRVSRTFDTKREATAWLREQVTREAARQAGPAPRMQEGEGNQ